MWFPGGRKSCGLRYLNPDGISLNIKAPGMSHRQGMHGGARAGWGRASFSSSFFQWNISLYITHIEDLHFFIYCICVFLLLWRKSLTWLMLCQAPCSQAGLKRPWNRSSFTSKHLRRGLEGVQWLARGCWVGPWQSPVLVSLPSVTCPGAQGLLQVWLL